MSDYQTSDYQTDDFTFSGICGIGGPGSGALAYLVALIDSPHHEIAEPGCAYKTLAWLFDEEEQAKDALELVSSVESWIRRFSPRRFLPQTPVILTQAWSPIGAMLERGLEPRVLRREPRVRSVATGVWEPNPALLGSIKDIKQCTTDEELFWAILAIVFDRAIQRRMLVSVIAKPGWSYHMASGLRKWRRGEVEKADRILWKRTPVR